MIKWFTPRRTLALVLIVAGALYLSLFTAPPLDWDDDSNIFANPYFRADWWSVFWSSEYFGLYVPVTSTIWHALYVWGGGAAWPYRVLNAGLHLANTILVYVSARAYARRSGDGSDGAAALAAAIFALHPLQTGAVAWISGGRDLLAACFGLIAVLTYFRDDARVTRALATLAFVTAVLSKPSVVVLPLVIAALTPALSPRESWRRHAPWLGGWLAIAAAVVWRTIGAQAEHLATVAWWQRPWLMGDAYWFYEARLINVFGLAANYARTPAVVLGSYGTLITAGLGLGAVVAAACWPRARTYAPLVSSWAMLLLPVSGLVAFGYQRTSGVADHYAYLALAPAAIAAARAFARHRSRALTVGAVIVLVAWTIVDQRRLDVWRSNAAFFTDMARAAPTAYATAIGMSSVACAERRDFADGVRWTEVALAARPLDIRALANQAYCLLHDRQFARVDDLASYFDRLDQARLARVEPTAFTSLLASVGSAKIELGRLKTGYQFLCEAVRILPSEPIHHRNLDLAAGILRRQSLVPRCAPAEGGGDDGE